MKFVNLPNTTPAPNPQNLTQEAQRYWQLYTSLQRTQDGEETFSSSSSGADYSTSDYPADADVYNKGQQGMMNLLYKYVLNQYIIDATDFNDIEEDSTTAVQNQISPYTCVKSGTTYALTGAGDNIKFVADVTYAEGDAFTINGTPVEAKLYNGKTLPNEFFVQGSMIFCLLSNNVLFFNSTSAGGGGTGSGLTYVTATDASLLPSDAAVGTIGLITSTEPTNVYFAAEAPSTMIDGDVFVDIGSMKQTEKTIDIVVGNVTTKITILNAYQRVDGALQIIKTYIKTTDLWSNCATELFSYGDINTDFTGGLIQYGSVTINDNQNGLIKMNNGNGSDDFFRTGKQLNWNNFNTVCFIAVKGERNRSGRIVLYYSNSNVSTTTLATKINEVTISGNIDNQEYQIAADFATGNHYLIMSCYVSGSTLGTYCDISRVYLI